ncbi:MAG: Nif3-like dinuclear metal center hexameric protein [Planctomycetota bacterium]|jgi:putative NIF3 family GTP cyclohydrolase 1 type 2
MNRREFIERSGLGTAAFSALAGSGAAGGGASKEGHSPLTANDVQAYVRSLGADWVDPRRTVDTFKAGDPATEVRGIAVGWMSYFASLKKAVELGCNLFVTHEPTYYDHRDADESVFAFETARKKKGFIEESGLAVIRCHDVWDRVKEIGIRDAWARFLGLEKELPAPDVGQFARSGVFCGLYELPGIEAGEFAREVAQKISAFGQNAVLLIGPEDRLVHSVAIGTGAITPFRHMVHDLGADIVICTDDGFSFWRDGSLAIDVEQPVIVVNHPCSEEIGMKRLAEHLAQKFPQVPVHHVPQKCMFKIISAGAR